MTQHVNPYKKYILGNSTDAFLDFILKIPIPVEHLWRSENSSYGIPIIHIVTIKSQIFVF